MRKTLSFALALAGVSIVPALSSAQGHAVGAVYTLTNNASGNAVQIYNRYSDGHLQAGPAVPTGGNGSGAGLGSQGAVTLTDGNNFLLAVNAGSNTISAFRVGSNGLALTDVAPSGGIAPISIAQNGNLVYVLNAGDGSHVGNVQGFRLDRWGNLTRLPGAFANLSGIGAGPAEVLFNPTGNTLVVTEKSTNKIDTFKLNFLGWPVAASYQASNGATPFGFDVDPRGRLFVAEANGGAVDGSSLSSYRIERDLDLDTISPSAPTTETAACWAIVSKDGKYVYTTNAGSGTVSGYRISRDGSVELLNSDGVTASTGAGSHPIDLNFSNDGKFLYVLANGAPTIAGFRFNSNGSLTSVGTIGASTTYSGLAVR